MQIRRRNGLAIRLLVATTSLFVLENSIHKEPVAQPTERSDSQAEGSNTATARPNIVLIVTDDQRWDTLRAMPNVRRLLAARGMTFKNAFVVNPVCCPSRASIFTGGYSHTTGVYTNKAGDPHGGFMAFDDRRTIATQLQARGYRTGFVGKYLNGYRSDYVPPGWDSWFATFANGGFYDYTASINGRLEIYGSKPADFGTKVMANQAVTFLKNAPTGAPLFLYFGPHAPHSPATPAPRDLDAFKALKRFRPASYDELNVTDKPSYIADQPTLGKASRSEAVDAFRLDQLRSLLSVDRAIGRLVKSLQRTGRLSNTMILFTSDNGMLWGEHRWTRKDVPYEESIRVPLIIRYDPLTGGERNRNYVLNIDIAPTFADLAGVRLPDADGRSLVPHLRSARVPWRDAFVIEHLGRLVPTYCALRTKRHLYVVYKTGERELYDLRRDPHEMVNRARELAGTPLTKSLRTKLARLCSPTPPGFPLRLLT